MNRIKPGNPGGKERSHSIMLAFHGLQVNKMFSRKIRVFCYTFLFHRASFLASGKPNPEATLSIFLTKTEIRELTRKIHHAAQARTLAEMGIRFMLRPDGSPVVLHSALQESAGDGRREPAQPDFSSLEP